MSKLKVDLQLNAASYSQGMEEAKKVTKEYTNEVANIRKELPNAQQEYRRVLKDVNNLTLAIQRMTKAERDSAEGRAMTKMLQDAKVRAAELNDMIGDTRQEIKNMASDTRNIDAMGDAFALVGNTLSGVAGAIGLATGKQEDLNKAIAAFTTVQSITNAMTKVGNILQKQSSLMNAITIAQEKMKTAAVNLETGAKSKNIVVTKAATAAQWALNAAADANPYVLLASALVAVGVALYGYIQYTKATTEEEARATKEAENLKKKQDELRKKHEEVAQAAADASGSFMQLKTQWGLLKTEAEKKKWIEDNQSAFEKLGISVNSVTGAENVFVKNTDAVVQALLDRAIAAKKAEQAADDYIKLEKSINEIKETGAGYATYNNIGGISDEEADAAGVRRYRQKAGYAGAGNNYYSDEEVEKINKNRAARAKKSAQDNIKEMRKAQAEIRELYKQGLIDEQEANSRLMALGDRPKATGSSSSGSGSKVEVAPPPIEVKPVEFKIPDKLAGRTEKSWNDYIKKLEDDLANTPKTIDGRINVEWLIKFDNIEKIKKEMKDPLEERKKAMEQMIENAGKVNVAIKEKEDQDKKDKDDEVKQIENRAQAWSYYGDMIQGVGAAMSKFMDEDTAAMVQWVANSAAMVAQTISQIMAMQASAMAKATDSGASLPFPANIAAIATGVGAVLSIFASLPAFAEGGVVSGPYSSGDRMLARVNAGERILTAEQNETFNELSKNMGGSASVAVRLDVSKVRGGDMYLAIKNYMKENNKTW